MPTLPNIPSSLSHLTSILSAIDLAPTYGTVKEFLPIGTSTKCFNQSTAAKPKRMVTPGKNTVTAIPRRVKFLTQHSKCVCCGITASVEVVVKPHGNAQSPLDHVYMCGIRNNQLVPLTVDHILAESVGGKYADSNFQTMCQPCNNKKSNLMSAEEIAAVRADPYKYLRASIKLDAMFQGLDALEEYIAISQDSTSTKKQIRVARYQYQQITSAIKTQKSQDVTVPPVPVLPVVVSPPVTIPAMPVRPEHEWINWWNARPSIIKTIWYWLVGMPTRKTTPKVAF